MSKQVLIKVCGIKTPKAAFATAKMGADFIGVVFHPCSKRLVSQPMAKIICEATESGGAKTVGVFVNHIASKILSICELTGIRIAQLHGAIAKREALKLPQNITRIYVVNVEYNGKILDDEDKRNIERLEPKRDYLLFDGIKAGSGEAFNFSQFKYTYDFPFFLAGGLGINNVKKAIRITQPNGVDVSSKVENIRGEKDLKLIKQFILRVKEEEKKND